MSKPKINLVPPKPSLRLAPSEAIAILLIFVYPLQSIIIPSSVPVYLAQVVSSLAWIAIGVASLIAIRRVSNIPGAGVTSLTAGISFIAVYMFLGTYMGGLGRNPLGFSTESVLLNSFWAVSMVFGMEASRNAVLSVTKKKSQAILVTTILFTASTIPFLTLSGITLKSLVELIGSRLPFFVASMMAGIMNLLGGLTAGIAFMGAAYIPLIVSPVLPNLNWLEKSFTSLVAVVIVYSILSLTHMTGDPAEETSKRGIGQLYTALFIMGLVWLSNGALGYQAVTVTSGSMTPSIGVGDLVIVNLDNDNLQVGDVILFDVGHGYVLHRIESIESNGASKVILTKGDANSDIDPWVVEEWQVVGVKVYKIPWLGWPSIWVRQLLSFLGSM